MTTDSVINATRHWVEKAVIGLNLCPFAKRELKHDRIRFTHTPTQSVAELKECLAAELNYMDAHPTTETTLLIHPQVLQDFYDYNDFLYVAEALIIDMDLEGIYQIASFHPDYQFAGTTSNDVENYTNRSPYPMLHILREESLARAIDNYPDSEGIPDRNIALMQLRGLEAAQMLLKSCFELAKEEA